MYVHLANNGEWDSPSWEKLQNNIVYAREILDILSVSNKMHYCVFILSCIECLCDLYYLDAEHSYKIYLFLTTPTTSFFSFFLSVAPKGSLASALYVDNALAMIFTY